MRHIWRAIAFPFRFVLGLLEGIARDRCNARWVMDLTMRDCRKKL
jgi:hypothetical protein